MGRGRGPPLPAIAQGTTVQTAGCIQRSPLPRFIVSIYLIVAAFVLLSYMVGYIRGRNYMLALLTPDEAYTRRRKLARQRVSRFQLEGTTGANALSDKTAKRHQAFHCGFPVSRGYLEFSLGISHHAQRQSRWQPSIKLDASSSNITYAQLDGNWTNISNRNLTESPRDATLPLFKGIPIFSTPA